MLSSPVLHLLVVDLNTSRAMILCLAFWKLDMVVLLLLHILVDVYVVQALPQFWVDPAEF